MHESLNDRLGEPSDKNLIPVTGSYRGAQYVAGADSLEQALDNVVRTARQETHADHVALFMYDVARRLVIQAQDGESLPAAEETRQFLDLASSCMASEADTEHAPCAYYVTGEELMPPGVAQAMCALVRVGSENVGVLLLCKSHSRPPFEEADERLACILTNLVAVVIENDRLLTSERERARQAASLLSIARAAESSIDLDEVLSLVAEETSHIVGADLCFIWLLSDDGASLQPAALHGMPEDFTARWKKTPLAVEGEPLSREALTTRRPVIIAAPMSDPRTDKGAVQLFADRSILVVPLLSGNEALGTMFLNWVREQHDFTAPELALVQAIAAQVGASVRNAMLHQQARDNLALALESERRYRNLFESADDAIFNLDVRGRLLLVNRKAEALVGRGRGDLLGSNFVDLVSPERQDWLREMLAEVREGGSPPYASELELLGRGEAIPLEVTISPTWHQGTVRALQLIGRDIRLRRQAEAERERLLTQATELAARLRASLYQVGMALASGLELDEALDVIVRLAADIIRADFSCLWFLEEETGDLVLRASAGLGDHPQQCTRIEVGSALDGQVVLSGEPLHLDSVQDDPRSKSLAVLVRTGVQTYLGVPLRIQERVVGTLSLLRRGAVPFDPAEQQLLASFAHQASVAIERRQLYAAIVQQWGETHAIIQSSADAIMILDADRRLVRLNPAAERLFGQSSQEMLGLHCQEVICGLEDRGTTPEEGPCPFDFLSDETDSIYREHQIVRPDGRRVDIGASYGVIRDERHRTVRVVAVLRDISRQKELQRMWSEFVSTVSHELRTPLALIKGYVATLLRPDLTMDDGKRRRFLSSVDTASDRLGRLIDNLLSASQLEAGSLRMNYQPLDLGEVIRQVVTQMKRHPPKHRFQVEVPPKGLSLRADRDKVVQVLINMISNAIKYSPAGSPITIVSRVDEDSDMMRTSIADQGEGIPVDQLERIFEKFYRVTEGSSGTKPGVGLGLYICRTIVEAHGGLTWAESEPGKGSTFVFTLPLHPVEGQKEEEEDE